MLILGRPEWTGAQPNEMLSLPKRICLALPRTGRPSPMNTSPADSRAHLRIVTRDKQPSEEAIRLPDPKPCSGTYTCECEHHTLERAEAVRQGVRPLKGNPLQPRRRIAA